MKKLKMLLSAIMVISLGLTACGEDEGEATAEACENYQQTYSTEYEECTGMAPGTPFDCSALEAAVCDQSDYFDCLAENSECMDVGGTMVFISATTCTVPTCD